MTISIFSHISSRSFGITPFCPSPDFLWQAASNNLYLTIALFTLPRNLFIYEEMGFTMLPRLALNSSAQVSLLPQFPR